MAGQTTPYAHREPAAWHPAFGTRSAATGGTAFRVWAPKAGAVELAFPARAGWSLAMTPEGDGAFAAEMPQVGAGDDYGFRLDGGALRPDPVSRWQPAGVHGPSRVVDPGAFPWRDTHWRGLPLQALVFYELHTGTFTPQGTFDAVIERLPYLQALGVTAVELMPVAAFPGARNWGYDGAHLYAPQESYGGPEGLKRLVDACHARGLALFLDVVYNHLGPEGNYLGEFGPYFTGRYRTPWGEALNFDDTECGPVRRYIIDNALYWLTEYHVDGLRLDAIHGIFDFGARHVLAQLAEEFQAHARRLGRQAWLIAESDLNDVRVINPRALGGWGLDAQWNDDFHHALHALLTGDRHGYFADFGGTGHLARALERGFVLDGGYSVFRRRSHGNSAAERPGRQFVGFVQNHDQIANPSCGDRLSVQTSPAQERLAACVLLCAAHLPLLFMGQEFAARTPFHYFTSHGNAALARDVSEGRRREMVSLRRQGDFHDPQSPATFAASRLDWACLGQVPHAGVLRLYERLLALRRTHACLHDCDRAHTRTLAGEDGRWLVLLRGDTRSGTASGGGVGAAIGDGHHSTDANSGGAQAAQLFCNFNGHAARVPVPRGGGDWRLALWSEDPQFSASGGSAASARPDKAQEAPSRPLATCDGAPFTAPPPTLHPDALADGMLSLGAWSAALYLRGGGA
ncbi:MAG: malto-oligosyltrehalose trehalohydrolase [Candidatus Lambdaproteobacteria bacterium]|nr:malto-oligosyltrehalose trehalohydrolase [Candidatus Lambdaproteobacteria bacterium]